MNSLQRFTSALALALAILAPAAGLACGPASRDSPAAASPDDSVASAGDPQTAVSVEPTSAGPTGPTAAVASASGLAKLAAVKALPDNAVKVAFSGYPGSAMHYGAFLDASGYQRFATLAGLADAPRAAAIDWDTQAVAVILFDAQTNALGFQSFDPATGTLRYEWQGIEPHYQDATPAVLAVVPRELPGNTLTFAPTETGLGAASFTRQVELR